MARLGRTISMLPRARLSSHRASRVVLQETALFGPNPGGLALLSYIPASLPPGAPLVVVLHGCTQSAEGYARGAGWIDAANRFGFALLCPEQSSANNPNLCFNWFAPVDIRRNGGEAASIAQMIRHMIAAHDLDPGQVFITGLSAGGAMANVMLATHPELFRAGAIIAGLPFGVAGNVQEAFAAMAHHQRESDRTLGDRVRAASAADGKNWPRIAVWHGDNDATVSPAAGDAVARQWADVHGASAGPSQTSGQVRHRTWLSADGQIVVGHHTVPGMGHGTPLCTTGENGIGFKGPYLLDVGVSSTVETLKFWGLHDQGNDRRVENLEHQPAAAQPAAPRRIARSTPMTAPPGRIDVGDVINSALRAAGLLK